MQLNAARVKDLIECKLAEADAFNMLQELGAVPPDVETLTLFIDALMSTLEKEALQLQEIEGVIDCSGTGGSGQPHYNTSTTAAFVLAAGGLSVAKFGNRGAQSLSGSFDLLELLGVPLSLSTKQVKPLLDETGLVFLFAPHYYKTLAGLAGVRKALARHTIFNTVGPLLNPLRPAYRIMGTANPSVQELVAHYLAEDPRLKQALVVRSDCGLDELHPGNSNVIYFVNDKGARRSQWRREVSATAAGSDYVAARTGETWGASGTSGPRTYTPEENLQLFHSIISGSGPDDLLAGVCVNAGAGFLAAGKASDIEAGAILAARLIEEGAVKQKYENCRRAYARAAG